MPWRKKFKIAIVTAGGGDCWENTKDAAALAAKADSANAAAYRGYGSTITDDDDAAPSLCSWFTELLCPKRTESEGEKRRLLQENTPVMHRASSANGYISLMTGSVRLEDEQQKVGSHTKNPAVRSCSFELQQCPASFDSSYGARKSTRKDVSYDSMWTEVDSEKQDRNSSAQRTSPSDRTEGIFNPHNNCFEISSLQAVKAAARVLEMKEISELPALSHFLQTDFLTRAECISLHFEMRNILQENTLHPDLAETIDANGVAWEQQDAGEFLKILLMRIGMTQVFFQKRFQFTDGSTRDSSVSIGEPLLQLNIEGDAIGQSMSIQELVDRNLTTSV